MSFETRQFRARSRLRSQFRRFKLGDVLRHIWVVQHNDEANKDFHNYIERNVSAAIVEPGHEEQGTRSRLLNFLLGRMAHYACLWCRKDHRDDIERDGFLELAVDTFRYYRDYADPISNDEEALQGYYDSKPQYVWSRLMDEQRRFARGLLGHTARLQYLWDTAVDRAVDRDPRLSDDRFDFESAFEDIFGCSRSAFIDAGIPLWFASIAEWELKWSNFSAHGVPPPDREVFEDIVSLLSLDKREYQRLVDEESDDERFKSPEDQRFQEYAPVPIFHRPVVELPSNTRQGRSSYCVPMPELLNRQLSDTIYWEMRSRYGKRFLDPFFASVFEQAVGLLLEKSVSTDLDLIGERALWNHGLDEGSATPDWVVVEPNGTVVALECKASAYRDRMALAITDGAYNQIALSEVRSGAEQLADFRQRVVDGRTGIDQLDNCNQVLPVVVTYGHFPIPNSEGMRKLWHDLNVELEDGLLLPLKKLEIIQEVLESRESVAKTLDQLKTKSVAEIGVNHREENGPSGWLNRKRDEVVSARLPQYEPRTVSAT